MREPTSALDALLESETTIGHFTLHPLTIQRVAVLELLESPFIISTAKHPTAFDVMAICWVMTSSTAELRNAKSSRIQKIKDRIYSWYQQNNRSVLRNYAEILLEFNRQMKLCAYVAPESREMQVTGTKTSNGWLVQTLYCALQLGIGVKSAIEETPLCQLLLLRRQKQYNDIDGVVWTLMDKEFSDKIDRIQKMRAQENG